MKWHQKQLQQQQSSSGVEVSPTGADAGAVATEPNTEEWTQRSDTVIGERPLVQPAGSQ